jgi:hypothetical protein
MSIERLMSLLAVGIFCCSALIGTAASAQVADPNRFKSDPNSYKAYKAAQKYPQVFKAIFCYCGCDKDGSHTNLLDCFRDEHGASCGICKAEAIQAANMKASGADQSKISKSIDASFGKSYRGAPSPAFRAYKARVKSNWM